MMNVQTDSLSCIEANKVVGKVVFGNGICGHREIVMADYKERFDRWQKKATEKLEEIDAQLGLKDKIEGGARVVVETAQKGAVRIKTEAEKTDVGKQAVKVAEGVFTTAGDAAKTAWSVSEPVREAAGEAGVKAGGVVVEAAGKAGE